MTIEFFTAGCRLCQRTLDTLQQQFPNVTIQVHQAAECQDGSCCALAERYGVRAVPSFVVNGRVELVGVPLASDLERLRRVLAKA